MEKAYILISCEVGAEHDLAKTLKQIEEITSVIVTYGDYDLVVEVTAENPSKMDSMITSKIRKLAKIRSTITLKVI